MKRRVKFDCYGRWKNLTNVLVPTKKGGMLGGECCSGQDSSTGVDRFCVQRDSEPDAGEIPVGLVSGNAFHFLFDNEIYEILRNGGKSSHLTAPTLEKEKCLICSVSEVVYIHF